MRAGVKATAAVAAVAVAAWAVTTTSAPTTGGGPADLAVATSSTTTAPTTTSTTSTTVAAAAPKYNVPSPNPPAPSGFAGQVSGIYSDVYDVVGATNVGSSLPGGSSQLPTPGQFAAQVAQLTPEQLGYLYDATSKVPQWSDLPADYQDLLAKARTAPAPTQPVSSSAVKAALGAAAVPQVKAAAVGTAAFPPAAPTGSFPSPPAPYLPTSPVGLTNLVPANCPLPPPGQDFGTQAVLSAQTAVDTLTEVINGLPSSIGIIINAIPYTIPDPAIYVLTVVLGATDVVLQTFNWMMNSNNDCGFIQTIELVQNIDNTTVNNYDLLLLEDQTIDNIESSVNTIHGQLDAVQQTLDAQLTLAIQQALAQPSSSVPNIAFEIPASAGGNLDSQPIGVAEVVTNAIAEITASGQPLNAAAPSDLALADAALAAHNYRQAYTEFHLAYLEAIQ